MDFTVEFYEMEDGRQPAREFLLSLDKKMRAKLLHRIVLLRDNGTALREPYSKPIGDGIFELRTVFSSNITRVLYFLARSISPGGVFYVFLINPLVSMMVCPR